MQVCAYSRVYVGYGFHVCVFVDVLKFAIYISCTRTTTSRKSSTLQATDVNMINTRIEITVQADWALNTNN